MVKPGSIVIWIQVVRWVFLKEMLKYCETFWEWVDLLFVNLKDSQEELHFKALQFYLGKTIFLADKCSAAVVMGCGGWTEIEKSQAEEGGDFPMESCLLTRETGSTLESLW